MKHVVVICPGLDGKGAVAAVAIRQARELAEHFNVTLVSDGFQAPPAPEVSRYCIKPLRFGLLRRFAHVPNEIAFAMAARRAVARLHRQNPVDLAICHGHPVATLAAGPLKRRQRIPYALVTHGDIFDRPLGTYDPRLTWFYQRVTPAAYENADLVIALSPHMAELAQRGGAPRDRIVVIPNGIDPADIGLDHATAAPARSGSGRLELLFVGRLSVEKGVDLLIRSAAVLQDQGIAFHLRIAGSGLDAESLRLQTTAMKLDERVEFLGTVPRKNLGALYQSADVLCVPSRSEPFGIVVLEAMAAGVAVVATRVGGIPYVVEDGVTGLLCPADDPVALAAALRRCAAERESTRAMGLAGLDRVARQFNWPKIGERLAEVVLTHPQSQPLSA
jgi:glycosyltransferase involved in cell wall biosynthesis